MKILFIILAILLFHFVNYGLLIFMYLITCDSLFSAIYFLIMYINNSMTKNDVVGNASKLYELSCLDRYFWYFICGIIYQTFCSVLWMSSINFMILGFIIINVPFVQNYLVNGLLKNFFLNQIKIKKNLVKELLSKQLSTVINSIGVNYMNRKDKIVSHNDVICIFDNYDQTVSNLNQIFENTVVVLLIMHLKSYSEYYYSIAKRVYNYQSVGTINTMNPEKVKTILNNICEKKQWEKLLEPNFVQAMLFMYYDEEFQNKNNVMTKILIRANYSILKFFAVWTISSLIGIKVSGPLIFYILYYYKWKELKLYNTRVIQKIFGITLGLLSCLLFDSNGIICFISEFAYYIVFNNLTKMICKTVGKKSEKLIKQYHNLDNQDLIAIGVHTLCGLSLCLIVDNTTNIHYTSGFAMLMSILLLYIAKDDMRKVIPIVSLLMIGEFSTYSPLHIILNVHHYYLLTNYVHSHHFYDTIYEIKYRGKYNIYKYIDKFNKEMELKTNEVNDSSSRNCKNRSYTVVKENTPVFVDSYLEHTLIRN